MWISLDLCFSAASSPKIEVSGCEPVMEGCSNCGFNGFQEKDG